MPETDSTLNPRCLRCGSDAMIPDVSAQFSGYDEISLVLQRRPDAKLLKRSVTVKTTASVCGECGWVELRAKDPQTLWEAHHDRLANE